jgi:hypothetical protein
MEKAHSRQNFNGSAGVDITIEKPRPFGTNLINIGRPAWQWCF